MVRFPKYEQAPQTILLMKWYPIQRVGHIARLTQTIRLAGAFLDLPSSKRNALQRCVRAACRVLLQHNYPLEAQVIIHRCQANCYLEVQLRGELDRASSDASMTWQQALRDSIPPWTGKLDLVEIPERPVDGQLLRFGQQLPGWVERFGAWEQWPWPELLKMTTLQEAATWAIEQYRCASQELARTREQIDRRGEWAGLAPNENLALLSLVASKSRNLITIMEPNGGILWVNQAFEEATGYSLAHARGRRLDELLFGPSTDRLAITAFQQAMASGHELLQEILVYRRDGNTFWVECNLIPVRNKAGDITCWLSVDVDITKWRQTEEALREAKRLAEENARMKSNFLANISHEIRTPMNAIIGMTELALATPLSKEQRDYLLTVQSAAESLLQLLNDVLDFSKIEAGKMTIDEVDFNLAEAVRDTLRALAVKAREKNLTLVSRAPLDLPVHVRGDPVRIQQILYNLVGNAIKFTERGEVAVELELQWQTPQELGYHIAVRDTGIGIPEEKLEKIFDAFSQADSSTTRRYGGTGLGLTITANLVRLMKGRIWVESTVGVGSTFHVALRLSPAAEPPPDLALVYPSLRNTKLLLIHHHAGERRFLEEQLGALGIDTVCTTDGAEASSALQDAKRRGTPFDAVLIGHDPPDVDAFPVVTSLRSAWHEALRHVILVSTTERASDAALARRLGIEGFLIRPVSMKAIAQLLDEFFRPPEPVPSSDSFEHPKNQTFSSSKAERSLRILVVDDHDANRKLATTVLEQRGHYCVEATNGQEAITLWQQQPFDVILMDVRMPEMDGFQATQTIRQKEKATGKHVPIVALTAHAMKGDREKCLAEGMDGYLAKPLRPGELVAMVESLGGLDRTQVMRAEWASPDESKQVAPALEYDFQEALRSVDNDQSLLLQQMQFFLKDGPGLVSRIQQAIQQRDARQLELAAHRLKSLTARYTAQSATHLAAELEQRAGHNQWDGIEPLAEKLADLVGRLCDAVRQYVAAQSQ